MSESSTLDIFKQFLQEEANRILYTSKVRHFSKEEIAEYEKKHRGNPDNHKQCKKRKKRKFLPFFGK